MCPYGSFSSRDSAVSRAHLKRTPGFKDPSFADAEDRLDNELLESQMIALTVIDEFLHCQQQTLLQSMAFTLYRPETKVKVTNQALREMSLGYAHGCRSSIAPRAEVAVAASILDGEMGVSTAIQSIVVARNASVRVVIGDLMSSPVIRTPAPSVETRSSEVPTEPRVEKRLKVTPSAAKSAPSFLVDNSADSVIYLLC